MPTDRALPLYNFDITTADTRASTIATGGLKKTTKVPNNAPRAVIRRGKAAEPVDFGLDMPILHYEVHRVS